MRELYCYNQLCNSTLDFSSTTGATSESSSPRSSSTDDDLLEIQRSSEAVGCSTSKPIYNFSIPDFIKHERQPVSAAVEASAVDDPVIVTSRPRDIKRRNEFRDVSDHAETRDHVHDASENASNQRRKKRRRLCQTDATNCPEFIDLTDVTDLDEASPAIDINHNTYQDASLSDVTRSNRGFVDGLQYSQPAVSLESVAENLQRFRRRLRESRDRINQMRREVTARESRLRNRLSHRIHVPFNDSNIVSDGPAYASQRDVHVSTNDQSGRNMRNQDYENSDLSVITVDDSVVDVVLPSSDTTIATEITDDSTFPPQFLTPRDTVRMMPSRTDAVDSTGESSDIIQQRAREQVESFERIRRQTQDRINEVRDRISRIDQRITGDHLRIRISDSPEQNRQSEDEVEFLRELRPSNPPANRNFRNMQTDLDASNQLNVEWGHFSRSRRRLSSLLSYPSASVPDFLFPYVEFFGPNTAPRLHHYPSSTITDAEDYEALWNLAERLGPAKPRGLSKSEIDRLHAFRFSAACAEETNSTCVVCMSEYCFREKIRKLPCTHDFHSKCIDKWLKSNKTCPVCRDEVKCV